MSQNLFNIAEEYFKLLRDIEEVDGVLDEDLEERLKINQDQLEAKCKAYVYLMRLTEGNNKLIDDEVERLNKIKKSNLIIVERFKSRLFDAVNLFGYEGKSGNRKLDFDTLKLYTSSTKVLSFNNEEEFNDEAFINFKLTNKLTKWEHEQVMDVLSNVEFEQSIDKVALKKALGEGEEVEGVNLVTKEFIVIK